MISDLRKRDRTVRAMVSIEFSMPIGNDESKVLKDTYGAGSRLRLVRIVKAERIRPRNDRAETVQVSAEIELEALVPAEESTDSFFRRCFQGTKHSLKIMP